MINQYKWVLVQMIINQCKWLLVNANDSSNWLLINANDIYKDNRKVQVH